MTNKRIRMVALDLDGTTLNSKVELSEENRNAIEEAARQGVYVVASTGRSFNSLPQAIKELSAVSYAITSNGAHINNVETGESIYDDYVSKEAIEEVIALKEKFDVYFEAFIQGQAYIDECIYRDIEKNGCPERNAEYVLWSRKPVPDIDAMMREHAGEIENINICFNTADDVEKAKPTVLAIQNATITSSFRVNLEVGGPNTSKKTALIELMSRLGISSDELMCCGDAPNDIQMLELAGVGIAMGNAWGGTKDHADYVVGTNDEDGVAEAFRRFVLK